MNSISNLIKSNFSSLSLEDKIKIKELGRPLPDLKLTQVSERRAENRSFTRHFSPDIYKKNSWICGCEVRNRLYCFPCVLFYNAKSELDWTRSGVKDLHHLPDKIRKHESSHGHMNSSTGFALLGTTNVLSQLNSAYRDSILQHNNKVRKNRHILMRIISCVKFCGAFELALRGHDESEGSKNQGIFKELIDFTAQLDVTLKEHLHNATVFKETSKTIQNDILQCMLHVCREEISKRVEKADFLSMQCDETSDVSNQCQMVIILRYLYEESIHEHFWSFVTVKDKTATDLKMCIQNEIDPLIIKTPHKLIAQTYDGAYVMSGVPAQMKLKYPNAHFVHCYAHQLNLILQKAVSQDPKVRIFFNNLSAIPAFFSHSAHQCDLLNEISNTKLPKVATTDWNYNIHTVNIVYENREKLIEVFDEIASRCEKTVTSNEASGLRRALQDPDFLFWLTLFHKIMPHVDILYNQLQSKNKDGVNLQRDIQTFEESIARIGDHTYKIEEPEEDIESQYETTTKRRRSDNDMQSVIAKEVCDVITTQMKDRFTYRGHLQAAELFNKDAYIEYSKRFPVDILDTVTTFYPVLCKYRLKTELEVLYSRPDLSQIVGAINILSFIFGNNLQETFREITKLLNIIVTTPMTTAEPERNFPTLKRIKTFLQSTMLNDRDRLNALAMMSINRNLILEINNFDERVMVKFISLKDHQADFNFRK